MRGARGNEGHDFFSFFSLSQKFLFGPLTLTGMLIFTFGFLHLVVITVLFEKKKDYTAKHRHLLAEEKQ